MAGHRRATAKQVNIVELREFHEVDIGPGVPDMALELSDNLGSRPVDANDEGIAQSAGSHDREALPGTIGV